MDPIGYVLGVKGQNVVIRFFRVLWYLELPDLYLRVTESTVGNTGIAQPDDPTVEQVLTPTVSVRGVYVLCVVCVCVCVCVCVYVTAIYHFQQTQLGS